LQPCPSTGPPTVKRTIIIHGCSALIALGMSAPTLKAQVEGQIVRVGLFAGTNPIVRSGCWSFVEVRLRWSGERALDGELRVDQLDRDGDVVTSVLKVALTPDGEWHNYQVYFVPNDIDGNNLLNVKLYDSQGRIVMRPGENGEEVAELVSPPMQDFPADEFLIVDLTVPRKLTHAAWLDSVRVGKIEWMNARKVRGLSPHELPDRWEGLEAVDAIVWDNADPSALSRQQITALVDWVKAGGRLLITAGTNWQALANSTLARALPVTITDVRQESEAQEFLQIVNNDDYEKKLDRHYSKHPIARCQMSPLPIALPIPADCANPQIAFRRLIGRGSLTFVGASLLELLPVPSSLAKTQQDIPFAAVASSGLEDEPFVRICEETVGRNFLALAEVRERPGGFTGYLEPTNLFHEVRKSIGFGSLSAVFLIFAILFALVYTIVATGGSYWYLKRRGWQHQCWTAFALVAVAGSVIGTGMVWTLRGVTTKVWQTTVVDGRSGLDYGHATCMFGVKTPDHTRLGLRLPAGSDDVMSGRRFGSLRVMPELSSLEAVESRFVAAENYRADIVHAQLIDVPVRATLKEFQGYWHGQLGGTLDAKLVARRIDDPRDPLPYEFAEGSYIRNNLGVDLQDCIILETREEVAARSGLVSCLYLGDLPNSAMLGWKQVHLALFYRKADAGANDPPRRIKRWPRLDEKIKEWGNTLSFVQRVGGKPREGEGITADSEKASLLLLSVFDLLEADPDKRRILRRSHGRTLDCTHRLTNRTAVLIGWSDDPPPAVLEIDGANYEPDRSRTMYRFVIPVERQ